MHHECDAEFIKKSERSRDASLRRDPDEEETRQRTESQRIAEGFEMLEEDDDGKTNQPNLH